MEIIDTPEKVYEYVSNIIETTKIKLDVKIVTDITYVDEILNFINTNYLDKDKKLSLVYSKELIEHYLINSLPLLFYSKNNSNKIVGLIIGKFVNINVYDKKIEALEGNFMCVIPQLRKLNLPKLIIAHLVKEGIRLNKINIKFGYYTTSKQISVKPICTKKFIHRCINYEELFNLEIVDTSKNFNTFNKLYSKFIYPEKFKQYKINLIIEDSQIDEITNKIKNYQKNNFDIYADINNQTIKDINNSSAFIKFAIINLDNKIEAFVIFYKLYILNKNQNKNVRTLYLHYYFADGNIIDYLEYIGEYMKKNDICDMFLTNLFDDDLPPRYFMGSGKLFYNLWNVKDFNIKEQRLQMIIL